MSRAKKTYRPSIVSKREHIPSQYVAIGSFHKKDPGLHRQLNRLCERHEVDAFRIGDSGPWFVLDEHVEQTKSRRADRREHCHEPQTAKKADAIAALTEKLSAMVANQFTLIQAIEQIADAVQRIADQKPLARMDDVAICEPDIDCQSNGFHS
jgi:hypothetical protein